MTGKHLGRSVHDLLDGRLDAKATAEAMAHLASCEECNGRYGELRDARERLTSSPAGIDMSFAKQLLDRDRMAEIAAQEDPHHVKAVRPPDHRPRLLTLGALVAVVGGVGAAYVAGAPETYSAEVASTGTTDSSGTAVASYASADLSSPDELHGWSNPFDSDSDLKAIGGTVMSLSDGSEGLIMTLAAGSDTVVVTERRARLGAGFSDLPTITTDSLTLYLVHGSSTTVVWENGDFVITASCEGCDTTTLVNVAGAFPLDDEPGLVDRLSSGLVEIADAFIGTD
ncbi:anti-sigma factor [Demequina sp. NBRC 110054]|uniref:anti-sigma factor family protein n=1 Tax=Demequina sp. NBRC 110054 TaxID=1570343 RepID=UPI000A059BFD|nr:zf-HC2 domain-containing protein [Demequina sp. NBRC 110054]